VSEKTARTVLIIIFSLAIGFMGYQAVSAAYTLHTTVPAPVQAANYIQQQYNPENTVIASSESYRHYSHYLPGYDVRSLKKTTPSEIYGFLLAGKTVISETNDVGIFTGSTHTFSRDRTIYPKHTNVTLFVYQLDKNGTIIVLGDGWYTRDIAGASYHMMGSNASLFIYSEENEKALLSFQAISAVRPRPLEVFMNNRSVANLTVTNGTFTDVSIPVTLSSGTNQVVFYTPEGCLKELTYPDRQCMAFVNEQVSRRSL
jgi:hypothetical protein